MVFVNLIDFYTVQIGFGPFSIFSSLDAAKKAVEESAYTIGEIRFHKRGTENLDDWQDNPKFSRVMWGELYSPVT